MPRLLVEARRVLLGTGQASPSPWGEGWGEGERTIRKFNGSSTGNVEKPKIKTGFCGSRISEECRTKPRGCDFESGSSVQWLRWLQAWPHQRTRRRGKIGSNHSFRKSDHGASVGRCRDDSGTQTVAA